MDMDKQVPENLHPELREEKLVREEKLERLVGMELQRLEALNWALKKAWEASAAVDRIEP